MSEDVFKRLVEQYSKLVYTVCYRLTNDYQEAENLTQETFIAAFKFNEKFIGDNYKAWLVKIASNKCKDYLKSAYFQRTKPVAIEDLHHIQDEGNPLNIAVSNEERKNVRDACSRLKEPYKSVAMLYYLEEKPFEEVAIMLKKPVKTIQTQAYRARDKLKIILKEEK